MTEYFRLGQYVRIGYRAWVNQLGGPVGDKKSIDQLEADYRASLPPAPKGPRPPIISGSEFYSGPPVRRKGQVTPREKRANGRVE